MNISKSLKVKNRIINELTKLQEVAKRENSRRSDNPSQVDIANVFSRLSNIRTELVQLKAAIVQASAPISPALAELAETKSYINWISGLSVREGTELVAYGSSKEPISYTWSAFYNRSRLDEVLTQLQLKANNLQDEIDDFNAQTQVNWEG